MNGFLRLEALPGPENMNRDRALLESGGLRVYRWDGPWITLGWRQSPERALIGDAVPWLERPTGGWAVLHGHDVTVAIAEATDSPRGIRATYFRLATPIRDALRRAGILAEFGGSCESCARGQDCFASTGPFDLIDAESGRKVAGCAMRATRTAALLQVSIPYLAPLVDPASVIHGGTMPFRQEWDVDAFVAALR